MRVIIQLLQEDKTGLTQIHPFSLPMGIAGMPHELREENIGLRSQVQNLQQEIDKQNNELQREMQKLRDEDNNKSIQITQLQQEKVGMNNEMQKFRRKNKKMKVGIQQLQQEKNRTRAMKCANFD